MGGDITVASERGRGSTFTVDLPTEVSETPHPTETRFIHKPAPGTSPERPLVLVIDDQADARDLMRGLLEREGFRAETAEGGEAGLELARRLQPTVITLDVMMPSMDGWAALNALKADPATAPIPVIMVTMVDERTMGFALGATDYFTKPIDWPRLATVLRRHRNPLAEQSALIVEDDERTREILRRTLEKDGWHVQEAANGRDGLEQLDAGPGLPGLILLDLMMPEIDGFGFILELRRRPAYTGIPVIVVTAKDLSPDDRHRLGGEVRRILPKGDGGIAELVVEIRRLLPGHSQPPA
jgi:CheY-like chemotaxis protein